MNKIIGIVGLTLALSACGGSSEEHKETTPSADSKEQQRSNEETQKLEGSIKRIESVDKEIQEREADLDKTLKELEGM